MVASLPTDLIDPDPEIRRRAVATLGPDPAMLPALLARLGEEVDPSVRSALCTHLATHDLPATAEGLIGYLGSTDAGLRSAAVAVLAALPVATAARIPRLIEHPDPDVRLLTVAVLAALRDGDVRAWLEQIVLRDPHPNVVSAALGELLPLAGEGCLPLAESARERFPEDPFIAFALRRVLQLAGQSRS